MTNGTSVSRDPVHGSSALTGPDRRIVGALLAHPRATVAALATAAGVTSPTASRRLAALLSRGDVRVTGVLDREWARAGLTVWLRVRCAPGHSRDVARQIASWDEAGYVAVTGGELDCAAQVAVRNARELLGVTHHRLRSMTGVVTGDALRVLRRFATPHGWTAGILAPQETARLRTGRWDAWDEGREPRGVSLDEVDARLVDALMADGRLSWRELGERAAVAPATAGRRVEALMRRGPLRVRAVVDPALVGRPVVALVWLRVLPSRLEVAGRTLAAHPDVLSVAATTGQHNLCGEIAVADDEALYRFLTSDVGSIPGVAAVEVTDGLEVIKRAARIFGSPLDHDDVPPLP
ncbi:Lrp/AsnC family transcriptional regulator [Isoptericola sp. NPDC056605]|uniref:Lrp/AsnC family transcriptional regulator n=1 Tax=Isoptericola sp. NPDC056605 TaxID=3345876 RepID=UPI00369C4FA2